jgi:hypothetical protein
MDVVLESREFEQIRRFKKRVREALRNVVRLTMRREKTTSSDEAVATAHRHLSFQALRAYVKNLYGSDNTLTEGQVTKKNRAWLGQRLQMFHKVHSLHDVEALNRVFRGESSVSVGYLSHGVPGEKKSKKHEVSEDDLLQNVFQCSSHVHFNGSPSSWEGTCFADEDLVYIQSGDHEYEGQVSHKAAKNGCRAFYQVVVLADGFRGTLQGAKAHVHSSRLSKRAQAATPNGNVVAPDLREAFTCGDIVKYEDDKHDKDPAFLLQNPQ